MIKSLKKKFILTTMFSITILLAILISVTAIVSYINIDKKPDDTLNRLIRSPYTDSVNGKQTIIKKA